MSIRTPWRVAGLAAAIALLAAPRPVTAAPDADSLSVPTRLIVRSQLPSEARVTYLTGGTLYLNAGRLEGLGEGDTVRVLHEGHEIALARVTSVSTHRAACDTLQTRSGIVVGDLARFIARPLPAPAPIASAAPDAASTAAPTPRASTTSRSRRQRGSVAVRYLGWKQATGNLTHQPALDVRYSRRGEGLELALDLRTRRTIVLSDSLVEGDDASARLYKLSATTRLPNLNGTLTVGRQTSTSLASVNLFDGGLVRWNRGVWSTGAFAGTQPNPIDWGFSEAITEYGAFADWQPPSSHGRRTAITLGAVTSYDRGSPSRDFAYIQGSAQSERWSVFGAQELDFARAWKRAQGDPSVALTSSFLTTRYQPMKLMSLQAGYDGRRNVRLWRDRITPETQFDDQYRQGAWIGAGLDPWSWLRLSGDTRYRTGGGENAFTNSAMVEARRAGTMGLTLRLRGSSYGGEVTGTRLFSGSLGIMPFAGLHLEGSTGVRETRVVATDSRESGHWTTFDLDLSLGSRWYLLGSWDHEVDAFDRTDRVMAGLQRSL